MRSVLFLSQKGGREGERASERERERDTRNADHIPSPSSFLVSVEQVGKVVTFHSFRSPTMEWRGTSVSKVDTVT